MSILAPDEFALESTYLNTASYGLPPARTLDAVRTAVDDWAAGRSAPSDHDHLVPELRAGYARLLTGATADDVALGASVSGMIGVVAAALDPGADVLVVRGEFSSVSRPFLHRGDLNVRTVGLDEIADAIRPSTALIALSVVQSADGRLIDLAQLRSRTEHNGTRILVDATQAMGWLPLRFADADYWVCSTYKWMLGARSVSFLAAPPDMLATLHPIGPGFYAGADQWAEIYAPKALADTARRFEQTPDWLGVVAAVAGLGLVQQLTVGTIGAHDLSLAQRFVDGLAELGYPPITVQSPIVAVPAAPDDAGRLGDAGIVASERAGNLRFSFHLYNSEDDVDRALDVLSNAARP